MYYIDWSCPDFPAIRPSDGEGDDLATVTLVVMRHHLEAAESHYKAMSGIINDYYTKTG